MRSPRERMVGFCCTVDPGAGCPCHRYLGRSPAQRRVTTAAASAEATVEITETMLPGHSALPSGFGLDYTDSGGRTVVPGVAPNALTFTGWRDSYAGTPWHKHVPARIEASSTKLRRDFSSRS